MIDIPARFFDVYYDGRCYPGAKGVVGINNGANCQQFAYELMRHFGYNLPNFRSSDLWQDTVHTSFVTTFEPLDLLLLNDTPIAYGAHVAVYLGSGTVIHLSKKIGKPEVISLSALQTRPEYQTLIGGKRPIMAFLGASEG
ncbi:MAG: NlpC/P60 family protein [bacterium]|nr:NlpC/P60 family protein [bacterium]